MSDDLELGGNTVDGIIFNSRQNPEVVTAISAIEADLLAEALAGNLDQKNLLEKAREKLFQKLGEFNNDFNNAPGIIKQAVVKRMFGESSIANLIDRLDDVV